MLWKLTSVDTGRIAVKGRAASKNQELGSNGTDLMREAGVLATEQARLQPLPGPAHRRDSKRYCIRRTIH